MSAELTVGSRVRPGLQLGIAVLLGTFVLAGMYLAFPVLHEDWAPAYHPLFWWSVGAGALFGVGQILLQFMPARWLQQLRGMNRHHMHLPREGAGYLVIMAVCFAGASMTHSNPLMLVFAAMAGPFIVNGSVTFAMLKNLQVTRRAPPRAMAGELFSVELVLRNQSRIVTAWLMTVQDEIQHAEESLRASVLFTCVPRRSEMVGHYQLRLPRRGRYHFGPIEILSRYPLGLVERSCSDAARGETLVYPRIGRLAPSWKRQLFGASDLVDSARNRLGMFDDEFHHLREYRSGDNPRAIHWRSSARRNELIVREYQTNREHNILVLVDLHRPDAPRDVDRRRVEQALSVVATLCWEHRRECRGASLTVMLAGRENWRWEASTASSGLDTLLDKLAVAEPAAENQFARYMQSELAHLGPTTRVVSVTTRIESLPIEQQTAVGLGHLPVQWLHVNDQTFARLLQFDDDSAAAHPGGTSAASPALQPQPS